jgi:hypothetical protein
LAAKIEENFDCMVLEDLPSSDEIRAENRKVVYLKEAPSTNVYSQYLADIRPHVVLFNGKGIAF